MRFMSMRSRQITVWVFILFGFSCPRLCAQLTGADSLRLSPKARWDTVSTEEMVRGYLQYRDTSYWWARPLVYEGSPAELFVDGLLGRNALFRNRHRLATWYWGVGADGGFSLYIEAFRDSTTGKADTLLLEQARCLYGQLPPLEVFDEPGGQVPAPWLNGQLRTLSKPLRYFSFAVSDRYSVYNLKQGRSKRIWREHLSPVYNRIAAWCMMADRVKMDGHWADDLHLEMLLLSHDASRYCRPDTTLKRVRSYDLLVLTDRQGYAVDIRVLKPDSLTAQDQSYVDELRRFFRQLPPWSLRLLYSSDGRVFPGHYLKADRSSHYWSLVDYLQDTYRSLKTRVRAERK